jgi:hypothetical protein
VIADACGTLVDDMKDVLETEPLASTQMDHLSKVSPSQYPSSGVSMQRPEFEPQPKARVGPESQLNLRNCPRV